MQHRTMAHGRVSGMNRALSLSAAVAIMAAAAGMAGVAGLGSTAMAGDKESKGGAEVIALSFHADWCGYCKELKPVYKKVVKKHKAAPVLFHVLDQTEDADKQQAKYMAHALGLEDVWAEHGGSTGFVLLIDAETGEVLGKITHQQELEAMNRSLKKAIAEASDDG